ncbi:MAG: PadR family transcriptional regulator [Actinomycetota bacterium]|nr:PadR family transcriptional regulator [Actinomycetota bacterium]
MTKGSIAEETVRGAHLLLLMSLSGSDKHGHALMKDVERFSDVHLGPGTLYKALGRLEELGYVEALPPDDRRLPYRLTPTGRAALVRSLDQLGRVVDEGRRRLRRPRSAARIATAR